MPQDWYDCFVKLAENEDEGTAFQVCATDRGSKTLIMAPHGGTIEPGTSEIAKAIAGDMFSLYLFEGLRKGRKHCELHITSHKFDEPRALKLAETAPQLLAIHGRADQTDDKTVWIGGRDSELATKVMSKLKEFGFSAREETAALAGKDQNNICNRSASNKGLQLEIPRALRDELISDEALLKKFSGAIRDAL